MCLMAFEPLTLPSILPLQGERSFKPLLTGTFDILVNKLATNLILIFCVSQELLLGMYFSSMHFQ